MGMKIFDLIYKLFGIAGSAVVIYEFFIR